MAHKAVYDKLDYFQRVEGYISPDGASLGKLKFAGIITGIRKTYGEGSPIYELTGHTDIVLANRARPFPGEFLSNAVTSAMLKSYLGTNELSAASDTLNPFTSGNYTSTSTPAHSSGTWSSTTDDGFTVVTCSTGSGAALISKTGAAANDRWHSQFAEITGRLSPSADPTAAGFVGIGLSQSSSDTQNSVLGYVQAGLVSGRYALHGTIALYSGNVQTNIQQYLNVLTNADDPEGMIAFTIGLLISIGGNSSGAATAAFTVNGKVVVGQFPITGDPGSGSWYPYLWYGTPSTGSATCYMTQLVHMTRYTTDGPSSAATFGNGTISTANHSLAYGTDPGPTFLEVWSRLATREGWYWRYTPQAYVVGTRTLGTVDFAADPGTDRGTNKSVVFSRENGSLVSLSLTANADEFANDTAATGQATLDGGGIGIWRDIASMTKYGVIQDEVLAFTHSDFNSLRRAAYQISSNRVNLSSIGSKTAVVLRDDSADVWRELDKVMFHDPLMGINYLVARIVGYTFTENDPKQTLILDQFSVDQL